MGDSTTWPVTLEIITLAHNFPQGIIGPCLIEVQEGVTSQKIFW